MDTKRITVTGSIAGVALLSVTPLALSLAAPAIDSNGVDSAGTPLEAATESSSLASSGIVHVANVDGKFSFDQNATTTNAELANVFNKAASSLCASLPDYRADGDQGIIKVQGSVQNPLETTVETLSEHEGTEAKVLACACASNIPGGGAVANVEVEGVSLQSIVNQAQVR